MAAGPVSIHFVFGETRQSAGNCFATPVLVGRDVTATIVVNKMRETAVRRLLVDKPRMICSNGQNGPHETSPSTSSDKSCLQIAMP